MKKLTSKKLTPNQKIIANDITRFKKNNLASNLAILSLVFECLFFLLVYSKNQGAWSTKDKYQTGPLAGDLFYTIQYGLSVVLNLVILLTVFYSSIELKNYNKTFSYVVWVVAVIQIVRIFIFPMRTYNSEFGSSRTYERIFGTGSLVYMILWLVLSAACLIAAGVIGFIRSTQRTKFLKQVENNEVDLEAAYKEEDVEEPAAEIAAEPAQEVSANA